MAGSNLSNAEIGKLDGHHVTGRPDEETGTWSVTLCMRLAGLPQLDARILLADANADERSRIASLLRKAGATVALAENGVVARDKGIAAISEDRPYDLILMDVQMPVMDGYEAARQLRVVGYCGPIVVLTSEETPDVEESCRRAGCDICVAKSLDSRRLLQLLADRLQVATP